MRRRQVPHGRVRRRTGDEMNRGRTIRLAGGASALALAMVVASFASCATNKAESDGPGEQPPPSVVPEASAPDVVAEASEDGGCDASDPGCTAIAVPCAFVAWCLEGTPVTPLNALTSIWGTS